MAWLHFGLLERPSSRDAALARCYFSAKAYDLFELMRCILCNARCYHKLPCLKPARCSARRRGSVSQLHQAFLACWRWLKPRERRSLKEELRWSWYCREQNLSALHHHILQECVADPATFEPFCDWCAAHGRRELLLFRLFNRLVTDSSTLGPEQFECLWQRLSSETRGTLLCLWLRVAQYGCHRINIRQEQNHFVLTVQLTPNDPKQTL
jgi:hypothetical protein